MNADFLGSESSPSLVVLLPVRFEVSVIIRHYRVNGLVQDFVAEFEHFDKLEGDEMVG